MTDPLVTFVLVPELAKFSKAFDKKRKDFYADAMRVIILEIVEGINAQVDITGKRFPALEPETIARKGHAAALIDKGPLSTEYTYQKNNQWKKDRAEITIKPITRVVKTKNGSRRDTPRNEVGRYLQIDGIDTKSGRKYFRFYGVSKDAEKTILYMADRVLKECLEAI